MRVQVLTTTRPQRRPWVEWGLVRLAAAAARVASGLRPQSRRRLRRSFGNRTGAERLEKIEGQIIRVSRLNSVGALGGAITHELGQPLAAVANYLAAAEHLLAQDASASEDTRDLVRKAASQARRASLILARVRAAVSGDALAPASESAAALVREAVEAALAGEPRGGLTLRYAFDETADRVAVDRIQVQQVVVNLVRNALDATRGRAQRELRIGVVAGEAGFVEIHVADSGPGISDQVADRLFQPFATDKPNGLGVGLSIAQGIIEAHGGRIWADQPDKGGATFRFTLPRAEAPA